MSSTLVVVGQGYVGLPIALRAAETGRRVVGLDTDAATVAALNAGTSHIGDITDDELRRGLAAGYRATTDAGCIAEADTVVVCVPTPLAPEGGPDLGAVEGAARAIGSHVSPGTLVILESTTYPGTTEEIFAPLVLTDRFTVGVDLNIAFSPERIDPGNTTYGVRNTPKVVGGVTPECTRRARDFYASFIDTVVEAKGAREAEMAKLLENTFRHVNIALVNEMVRFSQELDIDLWDAIDCAETKPFGFMAFRPGPGVGGHCIPVDPSYLSHRVKAKLGYAFRMVELAEEINHAAPDYVAARVRDMLNDASLPVRGSTVLLLGVTYKPDVADCRESPADPLAVRLRSWGADVRYHDPFVPVWHPHGSDETFHREADLGAAVAAADAVVLLQAHARYDLEALADSGAVVLDTRGRLTPSKVVARL
ncbi:nucleotide sugar dehydrogenase [Terracoccus luteus]|uniref:Nucleotide sugar dehydrogenase n=1 Tax=Terracoccus luteus TaxID=53356 RepID=A0A495Y4R5_9MICO|nr:nucleotide sugar dehydrogenase [Terracoccus luteus]MBB2987367.1 nucleotide sugar dehydrogenase [Terracoccus luteus]MCP2173018.1 nucleotide sugar dehydrogenase [Terracoccus luteus]RKT79768.1 nucleotide sugar dehydrogenase [Terracoccus luteus]